MYVCIVVVNERKENEKRRRKEEKQLGKGREGKLIVYVLILNFHSL